MPPKPKRRWRVKLIQNIGDPPNHFCNHHILDHTLNTEFMGTLLQPFPPFFLFLFSPQTLSFLPGTLSWPVHVTTWDGGHRRACVGRQEQLLQRPMGQWEWAESELVPLDGDAWQHRRRRVEQRHAHKKGTWWVSWVGSSACRTAGKASVLSAPALPSATSYSPPTDSRSTSSRTHSPPQFASAWSWKKPITNRKFSINGSHKKGKKIHKDHCNKPTLPFCSGTRPPLVVPEDQVALPVPTFASANKTPKKVRNQNTSKHNKWLETEEITVRWLLTGLRVLCSLKLSSRIADWSLESLSFFREVSPSSSSLIPLEQDLSMSCSSPLGSLSLRLPLTLDTVLFGDETPASSSQSTPEGNRFTSIPRRNDRPSPLHVSESRSACRTPFTILEYGLGSTKPLQQLIFLVLMVDNFWLWTSLSRKWKIDEVINFPFNKGKRRWDSLNKLV